MLRTLAALLTIGLVGLTSGQAEQEQGAKARAQQPSDTAKGSSYSAGPGSMSADGRYLVFLSDARDLVPGQIDAKGTWDVFLYDRVAGTTVLVSHAANLATKAGNKPAYAPNISADGSWITFSSRATDLVADKRDGNGSSDVFLYDRKTATNRVVSLARKP